MDVTMSRWQRLGALAANPWFANLTILLLQLGIVRNAWQDRDLTGGDTAYYFLQAWEWYEHANVNIAWSPLYTAYYGSMFFITPNVVTATLLHRLLIVCAATLLVLAVLRRVLPAQLAWWIAVWWAALPINFNTAYEVHLFALLPVLGAWLAVMAMPDVRGRAWCLGILCGAALLVRAEIGVACVFFGGACLVYEWRLLRSSTAADWRRTAVAYAMPLGATGLLFSFFYARSTVDHQELKEVLNAKHTVNMAQVFTFGYKQRHPEIQGINAWTGSQTVMEQHFGNALPTLSQMFAVNPSAVWQHFLWNCSLTPNGLQVLLFNATSGTMNPDYTPVRTESRTALALSLLLGLIWLGGLAVVLRDRRQFWQMCPSPNGITWCAILAIVAVSAPVILTQRPRPSYLFSLSVPIMMATGLCLQTLAAKLGGFGRLSGAGPFLMAAAILFVPAAYSHSPPRATQVRLAVERLSPFADLLKAPNAILFQPGAAVEVMAYVGKSSRGAVGARWLQEWPAGVALESFLTERGITVAAFDERLLCKLEQERPQDAQEFLAGQPMGAWHLLAFQNVSGDRFRLYHRPLVSH